MLISTPILLLLSCLDQAPTPEPAVPTTGMLDCAEDTIPALSWFSSFDDVVTTTAKFSFGQTHIIEANETRLAPPLVAERETLLLYTPDITLNAQTDLRVIALLDGEVLGVLAMLPPEDVPSALEQDLTDVLLEPYSDTAWSAHLPWSWVQEGVLLRVAYLADNALFRSEHRLSNLGAPHTTTLSRTKIVLFSDDTEDTQTLTGATLAQDMFSIVPGAEIRLSDYTPWRPDYFIVNTDDGPRRVESESERLDMTSDDDRWNILKHQMALAHSLANTGRGTAITSPSDGDSSPYSYGTSFAMGWVNDDGNILDINNSPYSAGWTGWTAIWLSECDNTLPHEFGHSFELEHFTSGSAASWGIDDEYPEDGRSLDGHPWGYDTTRRMFKTWYQVNAAGPVLSTDGYSGKYDPMNGGDAPNAIACYPQFTAYYGQQIQDWQQRTPNLLNGADGPGVYLWSNASDTYESSSANAAYGTPIAVDVPTALIIGTLGDSAEANQIYPPMHTALGNVFVLPHPTDQDLPSEYNDAQYFLVVAYDDGSDEDIILIAQSQIIAPDLKRFSLTADLSRSPSAISLYLADEPYPNLDTNAATLLDTRSLTFTGTLPDPIHVGRGQTAHHTLTLNTRCTEGIDCDKKSSTTTWRGNGEQRHFSDNNGDVGAPDECLPHNEHTTLYLPVNRVSDEGDAIDASTTTLVVHAQRVVTASGVTIAVPLNDTTPWLGAPDLEQTLRVWVPYSPNKSLTAGNYQLTDSYSILGLVDDTVVNETTLTVDLTLYDHHTADLNDDYWTDPAVLSDDSSVYFVTDDATTGPTSGVWWDGEDVELFAPVIDLATGEQTTLTINAYKVACDTWWPLNTGQSSHWNCDNYAQLQVDPASNEHLVSGHNYQSPNANPLLIIAKRWHEPNAGQILDTFALEVSYTQP
jgi:hypothetical protein